MSLADRNALALKGPDSWEGLLTGPDRAGIEAALPELLSRQRWFGGKARTIGSATIIEAIPIPSDSTLAVVLLIEIAYRDDAREIYVLPVAAAFGPDADRVKRDLPQAVFTEVAVRAAGQSRNGLFYDALWNQSVAHSLLEAIGRNGRFAGQAGNLVATSTTAYDAMIPIHTALGSRVMKGEQSNTSVVYGARAILKLYRRLQPGINPDLEIGRTLTSLAFPYSPAVGGAIEYVQPGGEPMTVALLLEFVPNDGDAWTAVLRAMEKCLAQVPDPTGVADPDLGKERNLWSLAQSTLPESVEHLIGPSLAMAACLGRRTAALHLALAQVRDDVRFTPEPLSRDYRRARYEAMWRLWQHTSALLKGRYAALPGPLQEAATMLLNREPDIERRFRGFLDLENAGLRIRCHGDYHLGQVLWTGTDCVLIDFEGEPARPLSERRTKHSPLFDVAGMLRSFHYASSAAQTSGGMEWRRFWFRWVAAEFLKAYITNAQGAAFWPGSSQARDLLLSVHLLEKAVYELGYELNNRPDWVVIPLNAILEILDTTQA